MIQWDRITHFKAYEFDSPDAPGSGEQMVEDFVLKLDEVRRFYGARMIITSGYRTPAHNKEVGGVDSSSHRGYAADVSVRTGHLRYRLIKAAFDGGINRIGIGTNFVHLDADPDKPPYVIWVY